MRTKQLNIKKRTYYHYNDLINELKFEAGNLKLDKKTWKNLDIYFIGYVDKKPEWNVNIINLLYLLINKVYGFIYFLTIDKVDSVLKKYDQVFSGIKHHINRIDDSEVVYDTGYDMIEFNSEDSIPLNKLIYFPTITVIIRCVFKQNGVFYPQVYLDDCLYQI